MLSRVLFLPTALALASFFSSPAQAQNNPPAAAADAAHGATNDKKDRDPAGVSLQDTGESALKKFSVAPGLRVSLWAAEPLLENPVAFSFDDKGRAFVVETYRRRTSVPDIRKHTDWL